MAAKKAPAKKKVAKQKPGTQKRLSDARIVEMWQKREELRLKIKTIAERQAKLDQEIIAEMERRGTTAIENGGQRVTYVQAESVSYDGWGIHKKLLRKRRRDVAARLVKEVIDNSALAAEMQAGNIDPELIAEFSKVNVGKPYLRGSMTGHE